MPLSRLHLSSLALGLFVLAASVVPSVAQESLSAVKGKQVPNLVADGKATLKGAYNPSETMKLTLNLALRNEDALDALIADLYNPTSPNFHKYLVPSEFDAQFGPTHASYETTVSWAESNGFRVVGKAANNRYLEVEAPVSAVNQAFHVAMTVYHDSRLNRDFYAPDREPMVGLQVALASVEGLDNSEPIVHHLKAGPHATSTRPGQATVSTAPAAVASQAIYAGTTLTGSVLAAAPNEALEPRITGSAPNNQYSPSDMRAAYYGSGPVTGTGQSVGIFSYDGYQTSDLTVFYAGSGFSSSIPVTNRLVGTYNGACTTVTSPTSNTCDDGEQILDIVNVQGMAPGLSNIYFYEYTSASSELSLMASDNLAKVLTSSWGGGGFGTASDTYFKQMATQGQTYLNATGDDGAFNSSTYLAPSLDPYIIQVGGTSLVTNGAGGSWASETAWPDSGGGPWVTGISSSGKYTIPAFQSTAGVITTASKGSSAYRNSPDMAAEGDYDNPTADNGAYLTGYGGTSFATPRMAGYIALVNQFAVANGGTTIGFFDQTMYTGGLSSGYSHYMHDITSGSNPSTAGSTVYSYPAVAGYDDVTGWGSPNGEGLLYYLAQLPDFTISPGSSSATITRGTPMNETVTVTPYTGFSASVTMTAGNLPTGVTYTATAGTPSTPATITFTADAATAIMGTYTIPITGVSGNITRTTSFVLNVLKRTNGDFTVSAGNVSVVASNSGVSVVSLSVGAVEGPIALTVSGLPSGLTASFDTPSYYNPGSTTASVNGTANLTVSVALGVVAATYPITVTGTSAGNIVHSTTFNVTVSSPPSYVLNGGFETASGTTATNWTTTAGVITNSAGGAHSGSWYAYLDGYGAVHTDTVTQTAIAIPAGKTTATLTFYLYIATAETTTTAMNDVFTVSMTPTSPAGSAVTLATYSNLNATSGYVLKTIDVSQFIGQTVTLTFTGVENSSLSTAFRLDDIALSTYPN